MRTMSVVLWDTHEVPVIKDFAGGMGIGTYIGGNGSKSRALGKYYQKDIERRPVALNYAYLAAIFKQLGHEVTYAVDRVPEGADLYVFNPSLQTIPLEVRAIREAQSRSPDARVLVVGSVANTMPEAFAELDAQVIKGEPEQLLWKLDDVLADPGTLVDVGIVADLDQIPFPDWSLFSPENFRVGYDFSIFPSAFIQQSRGCTYKCNYCPYIALENRTRFRDPERVVAEMSEGIRRYGFRSFKFRDPLFGLNRKRALKLAELIGALPHKIQFSIESRIDLLRGETLEALRDVGLSSITVGIETPDEETLLRYKRRPIKDDKQRLFVERCREMGIRTAAGFMIGFPDDTKESIQAVLDYAIAVNPTYAHFNIVTPYPGTEFFQEAKDQIAHFDYQNYTTYHPVMKYRHLTAREVEELQTHCLTSFYFRPGYLKSNAHLFVR